MTIKVSLTKPNNSRNKVKTKRWWKDELLGQLMSENRVSKSRTSEQNQNVLVRAVVKNQHQDLVILQSEIN